MITSEPLVFTSCPQQIGLSFVEISGLLLRGIAMYKIADAGDSRKYFAQIPNILDHIDLSVYAFRLYVHLKRVAGEYGYCNESLLTLKDKLKLSENTIVAARRELEMPRDELGGKSLITSETQPNRPGEKGYTMIVINDIWPDNIKFCEMKNASRDEVLHLTPRGVTPHGVRSNASCGEVKEEQELNNNNHTRVEKKEGEEVATADEFKKRTEEALFSNIASRSNGGLDLSKYPEDVRPVFRELYRLWGISPPSFAGKANKNSRAADWISGARELLMVCEEFGLPALERYHKEWYAGMVENKRKTGQGVAPHTVGRPASLINPIAGKIGEWRVESREVSQDNSLPSAVYEIKGVVVSVGGRRFYNGKEIVDE